MAAQAKRDDEQLDQLFQKFDDTCVVPCAVLKTSLAWKPR